MASRLKFAPPFATTEKRGLKIKPFRFLKDNSATTMPRVYHDYRPPQLKKTKRGWYIEYWFRVPDGLKNEYTKEWKRFRVFEDINRYKTNEYAQVLLDQVRKSLNNGYNPFAEESEYFIKPEKQAPWSLNTGLDRFMEYCRDKRLRENSIRSYKTLVEQMREYFLKGNKVYEPVNTFTKDDLKQFFKDNRKTWSNTTTNNYISFTRIIFNWFVKEDVIIKSPALALEILPATVSRHKYYPDELAEKLKKDIALADPELFEFMQMIYYCALRPNEVRHLQVRHILFDRKLLFVPAYISKNKTDDYIPLGSDVMELLSTRKEQPIDYYIFGGEKMRSQNYFTVHFQPYKEKYQLTDQGLYSWKHTRALHLAQAGADPYQIMRLFRHSSLEITMRYLRELGIVDLSEIHEKTKKF